MIGAGFEPIGFGRAAKASGRRQAVRMFSELSVWAVFLYHQFNECCFYSDVITETNKNNRLNKTKVYDFRLIFPLHSLLLKHT